MRDVNGYTVIEQLFESQRTYVARAQRLSDGARVVLKLLNREYPNPTELALFVREFELTRGIASAGVVDVFALENHGHSKFMVLEDIDGVALYDAIPADGLSIESFLAIATRIAHVLESIHAHGIIHKDINTTNIIWNRQTDALRIIDFGLATTLDRDDAAGNAAVALAGTLPFLAPEQTGRINRPVDERADLYALGVTFYEMLTRNMPYRAKTAMEYVHAHIAREPTDPREYNGDIPPMLADIVLHLLKKRAEDRYQTAAGLVADLQRYSDLWRAGRARERFRVGHADFPKRLRISPVLYGRDAELGQIQIAFGRCLTGTPGVVLITGEEGLGKSSLVREFDAHLASFGATMLTGKFEEHAQPAPYSALIAAFSSLLDSTLAAGDDALDHHRKRLSLALGNNARILARAIPQLRLLLSPTLDSAPVDEQPETESSSDPGTESSFESSGQHFQDAFRTLIRALCSPESPLVLHLDNLQWADSASLRLLESLLRSSPVPQFLVIGSVRNTPAASYQGADESRPSSPASVHPSVLAPAMLADTFAAMFERLADANIDFQRIELAPLSIIDTARLLSASLRISVAHARRLAAVVHHKTVGNPHFIHTFLTRLVEDGLLRNEALATGGRRWHWDIDKIADAQFTDNAVELMLAAILELPPGTQRAVGVAACIGYTFDLETVSALLRLPESRAFHSLRPALDQHLLTPMSALEAVLPDVEGDGDGDGDSSAEPSAGPTDSAALVIRRMRFQHDRVRDAAYQHLSGSERMAIHLQLARLMEDRHDRHGDDSGLFAIVRNMNAAMNMLDTAEQQLALARYNLDAGQLSFHRDAAEPAWRFVSKGLQVLPEGAWSIDHDVAFALHRLGARVAYSLGHEQRARSLLTTANQQARTALERAALTALEIARHSLEGQYHRALDIGGQALAELGVDLPAGDQIDAAIALAGEQVDELLRQHSLGALLERPEVEDPETRLLLRILAELQIPAYFVDRRQWQLITLITAQIGLTRGHTADASYGYGALAVVRNRSNDTPAHNYELGQFALHLAQRHGNKSHCARVGTLLANFLRPWVAHIRTARVINEDAAQAAQTAGDSLYAGFITLHQLRNEFFAGVPLERVFAGLTSALSAPTDRRDPWARDGLSAMATALAPLRSATEPETAALDAIHGWRERQSNAALGSYIILETMVLCIFGRFDEADERTRTSTVATSVIEGQFMAAEGYFAGALARAARLGESRPPAAADIEYIDNALARFAVWATHCPDNFQCREELMAAELARITDDPLGAMNHYDQALEAAREHRFVHIESLINERIAAFWTERGKPKIARIYIADAYNGYRLWGATGKEAQLLAEYPDLQTPDESVAPTSGRLTYTTPSRGRDNSSGANHALDIRTVLEAAQVLSREIVLERLIEVLLRMVIESAGARRGALLLKEGNDWYFQAEGALDRTELVRIFTDRPLASNDNLAVSVIRYAVRTGEVVLLGDATDNPRFASDSYIAHYRPLSLLCMPLARGGEVMGLLYLENELTADAFTPERVELLHLLSVHMVVSVANARLYQQAKNEIDERRRTEQALQRARDAAEAANRAKTAFLSNTSHELRTPLNAILGYAELLLADAIDRGDTGLANDLDEIRLAGRHLARLISDVLDLSRVEDGSAELELRRFDLDDVLSQLRADARALVTASSNRLQVEAETNLGAAHTDREKLTRAVLKVLENSVKFTRDGTITLSAWREPRPDELSDWLHISVNDTGIGIPHDQLARIFEAFTQVDSSPSRRYEGTGLGLTITKRFCDLLGGRVDVDSEEGRGTTLTLSVPIVHPRVAYQTAPPERPASAP